MICCLIESASPKSKEEVVLWHGGSCVGFELIYRHHRLSFQAIPMQLFSMINRKCLSPPVRCWYGGTIESTILRHSTERHTIPHAFGSAVHEMGCGPVVLRALLVSCRTRGCCWFSCVNFLHAMAMAERVHGGYGQRCMWDGSCIRCLAGTLDT